MTRINDRTQQPKHVKAFTEGVTLLLVLTAAPATHGLVVAQAAQPEQC